MGHTDFRDPSDDGSFLYGSIDHGRQYAYGMPGVSLALPIGNHAITIDEFKTIYAIFKKYEGKELFTFSNERFDYDA